MPPSKLRPLELRESSAALHDDFREVKFECGARQQFFLNEFGQMLEMGLLEKRQFLQSAEVFCERLVTFAIVVVDNHDSSEGVTLGQEIDLIAQRIPQLRQRSADSE